MSADVPKENGLGAPSFLSELEAAPNENDPPFAVGFAPNAVGPLELPNVNDADFPGSAVGVGIPKGDVVPEDDAPGAKALVLPPNAEEPKAPPFCVAAAKGEELFAFGLVPNPKPDFVAGAVCCVGLSDAAG